MELEEDAEEVVPESRLESAGLLELALDGFDGPEVALKVMPEMPAMGADAVRLTLDADTDIVVPALSVRPIRSTAEGLEAMIRDVVVGVCPVTGVYLYRH